MRKPLVILLLLIPSVLFAQGTKNDLEKDFGARIGVSLDKKIVRGLHVALDGEFRLTDNFTSVSRVQAGLDLSYKINKTFKVGVGYVFMEDKNSSGEWKPRHRVYADASATLRAGDWRFSFRERFQMTHRNVGNAFQTTPNLLELKSRFRVSYKGFARVTPYGYVEVRNVFNDPSCYATWSTVSKAYYSYSFKGYDDAYINRVRGALGAKWKVASSHSLDFTILGDYCYDKNIDTNARGTKLKSLTYDQTFKMALCVGYQFSF